MTDDLKERLQKHDWRHLTARIEQLEAEKAELHLVYYKEFERAKALEVLHGNEVNWSMELEAQLAAAREALQSAREYVSTDIDDGVPSERKARRLLKRIDAAIATAPATDNNHG